jgi:hypothetical protein
MRDIERRLRMLEAAAPSATEAPLTLVEWYGKDGTERHPRWDQSSAFYYGGSSGHA